MKVWLDDIRPAPEGWEHAKTSGEAIALLVHGNVTDISLDHDLGGGDTGYNVLSWLEFEVSMNIWRHPLPTFTIHSANPVGRKRMEAAIESIKGRAE